MDDTRTRQASTLIARSFGDLKIRPKLIVLHNCFFLVLTAAVYFSLAPLFRDPAAGDHARAALFLALGAVYVLAVALLELVIMPRYVYRPLRLLLAADDAARRGDRQGEIIPDHLILGDEIGQIMRSRNAAIGSLRQIEDDLERKNAQLEAAKRSLEQQDRLASLGLLSASVAHELNTPLAVLHGSIEKLMETVTDRQARERLERMLRVSERLRHISAGLVEFSRERRLAFDMIDLRSIVEEAWGMVTIDEKAAGVRFSNAVPPGTAAMANADRLVQVFVNLLRNALNAVAGRGEISVRARRLAAGGKDWISLTVEDDGPGIPPDILPSIFDAFVTTRLDARGTGLGLAVAEGIIRRHGGTIEASNRQQGGACLEVKLPAGETQHD